MPARVPTSNIGAAVDQIEGLLTPEEFIGFLKAEALLNLTHHRTLGGLDDLRAAAWAMTRLVSFIEREGPELALEKRPLFWSEGGTPCDDIDDVLLDFSFWEVAAIFSDHEPYSRWFVRIPIADQDGDVEGDEAQEFSSRFEAERYVREALEQPEEITPNASDPAAPQPETAPEEIGQAPELSLIHPIHPERPSDRGWTDVSA